MPCPPSASGSSLIEVILAMGTLAVALPLVAAVMARAGQSSAAAQAESRSAWIIPACMQEIEAAHVGKSRALPTLARREPFPAPGQFLALAFAEDGRALGSVERDAYLTGTRGGGDKPVRYLVTIHCQAAAGPPGPSRMRDLRLTLEYPSAAPATKRRKLDFHTRIP
jgi:Tfp pilus assembly protein PilV